MPRLNRNVFSGAFGDRRFGGVGIDQALEQADLLLCLAKSIAWIHLVQLPEGISPVMRRQYIERRA